MLLARLAALGHGSHGECPGAFKPNGVGCPPMQFEECVAVAASAMTKIRTFGQRSCDAGELATLKQEFLEFRRRERCIGKCRDHARCAVAMLTEPRRLVVSDRATP